MNRNTTSGIRYAKAVVNNVSGVILLPDDWIISYYTFNNANISDAPFGSNIITASQWLTLEQNGAVFLPAAGFRDGTNVWDATYNGFYWAASYYNNIFAYIVDIRSDYLNPENGLVRHDGISVRLVQDYQR